VITYVILVCDSLIESVNGVLECLLGDDIPDPGESCNVTCDDGYELTGNATRTCQDDGTWDGEEAECVVGEVCLSIM